MPVIEQFGGLIPRLADHELPIGAATKAHNVKLRNGRIDNWQEKSPVAISDSDSISLYAWDCCYHHWNTCVAITEYLPDYDQFYLTGRKAYPETAIKIGCALEYFRLGVPAPSSPVTVSASETYGEDCDSRSYVYTYVNKFGEESAPSPPSASVTVRDGASVTCSGFAAPPAGWNIEFIVLYRTVTGSRRDQDQEQELVTAYYLVAELGVLVSSYSDSILARDVGPILTTDETRVPPETLRHIRHINSTGSLVGVTNNQVHFSKDFQPYNWPAAEDWTLPSNIVNMVTLDTTIFISTDGKPIVMDGSPKCGQREDRQIVDCDAPYPDISCGYTHSAIVTPFGMIYASLDGLALLKPSAQVDIITSTWFNTDEWRKLRPETVRLAYWRGYIFCVTDEISFILSIDGNTYGDYQLGALSTISDKPTDMYVTSGGELLLMEEGVIYHWDSGKQKRAYLWQSRDLEMEGNYSPTAATVKSSGMPEYYIMAPDEQRYDVKVTSEKPFRLPRLGRHRKYRIGFSGIGAIDYVRIGTMETTLTIGV